MHVIDRKHKLEADILIFLLSENARLILTYIVTVKAVLERERVGDGELLPSDDTRRAYLVGLDAEAAILVVEHMCFLSKDTR